MISGLPDPIHLRTLGVISEMIRDEMMFRSKRRFVLLDNQLLGYQVPVAS